MKCGDWNAKETNCNRLMTEKLTKALREEIAHCLRDGFYGDMTVQIAVQDGVIQNIKTGHTRNTRPDQETK